MTDSEDNSRIILLEFSRKTTGQASCKSRWLLGGRRGIKEKNLSQASPAKEGCSRVRKRVCPLSWKTCLTLKEKGGTGESDLWLQGVNNSKPFGKWLLPLLSSRMHFHSWPISPSSLSRSPSLGASLTQQGVGYGGHLIETSLSLA